MISQSEITLYEVYYTLVEKFLPAGLNLFLRDVNHIFQDISATD